MAFRYLENTWKDDYFEKLKYDKGHKFCTITLLRWQLRYSRFLYNLSRCEREREKKIGTNEKRKMGFRKKQALIKCSTLSPQCNIFTSPILTTICNLQALAPRSEKVGKIAKSVIQFTSKTATRLLKMRLLHYPIKTWKRKIDEYKMRLDIPRLSLKRKIDVKRLFFENLFFFVPSSAFSFVDHTAHCNQLIVHIKSKLYFSLCIISYIIILPIIDGYWNERKTHEQNAQFIPIFSYNCVI